MHTPTEPADGRGTAPLQPGRALNVLMLLDPRYLYINTIRDYCESFDLYSRHRVTYASTCRPTQGLPGALAQCPRDFSSFDVLCINYSSRIAFDELTVDARTYELIRDFRGYKILFIQDEYDRTDTVREKIRTLGINRVFSCVPPQYLSRVYPPEACPGVAFNSVMTGYVPPALEQLGNPRPLAERPCHVVYRGRSLPYYYGELAREKCYIGMMVKAACLRRHLPEDIEWADSKRLYGHEWIRFLQSGRATLGTESGANVFDVDGSIRANIETAMRLNPRLTYREARDAYFQEDNIGVRMNQISPKLFEFIAAKTALILFEGSYSGVLEPGRHYLALKKDGSNLDAILDRLEDIDFLAELTERTYQDIVASRKYSFESFVRLVDAVLDELPAAPPGDREAARQAPAPLEHRYRNALYKLYYQSRHRPLMEEYLAERERLRGEIARRTQGLQRD